MEPLNALAFEKDGKWEIHTGNQWQSLVLPWLAAALEVPETDIVMKTYVLGGGFGRRLNGDYAVGAALAVESHRQAGEDGAVDRESDVKFDSVRSPSVQKMKMGFDKDNNPIAHGTARRVRLAHRGDGARSSCRKARRTCRTIRSPSTAPTTGIRVGAHKVRAVSNDLANATFRPGWLRSVGPGFTNWALESFMDEAAHKVKADPVQFRINLLKAEGANAGTAPNSVGGASRQANVVKLAAEKAGWGQPLPEGTGLGLATSFGQERDMPTWTACVARVKVDKAIGTGEGGKTHHRH